MRKSILVASGKGGTGKSAFSVNLGATLAEKGYKVALIDMDMGQGNLDIYLGLHDRVVYNVHDTLSGLCKIKQALIRDRRFSCLGFLPAAPHLNEGGITADKVRKLYRSIGKAFDYIIIDAPAGMEENVMVAATGVDEVAIVATPDYASIRGADMLDMKLKEKGIVKTYYIMNKMREEMLDGRRGPSIGEISSMIRSKVVGIIPYDENFGAYLNVGQPIIRNEASIMRGIFEEIAGRIVRG